MGIEMGTGRGVDVPAVVVALAFAVVDAYIYILRGAVETLPSVCSSS